MPTSKRLVYDDSMYHVIQKGNNGLKLFKDDEDFEMFLSIVRRYLRKFRLKIYHYCLMSTHPHLLLKIFNKEVLAKFMQALLQSYRFYYRRKYAYKGYLYQSRYRTKWVSRDEYLSECGRYIERNPVRAGIVKSPDEYRWSSCIHYTSGKENNIITENPLYEGFGKNLKERQRAYKEYVSTSRPYEEIMDKEFKIV
ncbi:MAG: transposase [Candidatus Gorgyraea atricola]|nr:transposase [Candidatus Gorgyraea atricola]